MKYAVTRAYLSGFPTVTPDLPHNFAVERWLQEQADAKVVRKDRPPIGPLSFEHSTDQIDARFRTHSGKTRLFATLMAAG